MFLFSISISSFLYYFHICFCFCFCFLGILLLLDEARRLLQTFLVSHMFVHVLKCARYFLNYVFCNVHFFHNFISRFFNLYFDRLSASSSSLFGSK